MRISRSCLRYKSKLPNKDRELIKELHRLKAKYPRWGYRKIHRLLCNEGWEVNHKRVQRLWRQEGLGVVRQISKTRARKAPGDKANACHVRKSTQVNQVWSVDFVIDETEDGKKLKILTVVDEMSREALAIEVSRQMDNKGVQSLLRKLVQNRGCPEFIRSDNGSEFIAKALQEAVKALGSETAYIAPGSPWQNGKNERFNGILRQEVLSQELFYSLDEAKILIERFRLRYNQVRPHGAIDFQTPAAFALAQRSQGQWFTPTA